MTTSDNAPVMAGTSALTRFQDAFAATLLEPARAEDRAVAALTAQPAFAVYRNTVMKGCVDALVASFPAVVRLTGEEWFRAAAAHYVRSCPPAGPALLHYGASFPAFLADFEPAVSLTYLPAVARVDRLWTEAHTAATLFALDPGALAIFASEALARLTLRPHPAARWAWFERAPIRTIWSRNREDRDHDADLEWQSEGILLVRTHDAVEWHAFDAAGCAFLDVCAADGTLAEAADAALRARPDADLARLMAMLLATGAFCAIYSATASRGENDR